MNRREFVTTSMLSLAALPSTRANSAALESNDQAPIRAQFPRLNSEVFLNAAGGTPLGNFAEEGIQSYLTLIREGPQGGTRNYFDSVLDEVGEKFANLIGAKSNEIGLIECTKRGEKIAIDGVQEKLRAGGNIVTNDLHFSGSLHNLEGLRRAGNDIRFVKSQEFAVTFEDIADSINRDTALVSLSLVSNINGHIEEIQEISNLAHEHDALVFADIIQAAGVVPIDVRPMGIDIAACSAYKWLYGIHGAGFLYVAEELQGAIIQDSNFPGRGVRNYPPFRTQANPDHSSIVFQLPQGANRYQPGHINYLGYCAAYEGLKFIENVGLENLQAHSINLNQRLISQLDENKYQIISSHVSESPILTFTALNYENIRDKLRQSPVNVGIGGDTWNQIRVSPAIYNTESDIDVLLEVLSS